MGGQRRAERSNCACLLILVCIHFHKVHSSTCTDNNFYTLNNEPFKTCGWVAENPIERCKLRDQDNIRVKQNCPKTCDHCKTKNSVGQFCKKDRDCESWTCRENTCYASPKCKALKQTPMQNFDEDVINLVFVGSGFSEISSWRMEVAKTFHAFNDFEFFEYENTRYNAFYVDNLEPESFCKFSCEGSPTLLCCDTTKAQELTARCINPGVNVNTIVIENPNQYGGGGYRYANLATTSTHMLGPKVAIHELGHSLFDLADEYSGSMFTASDGANCDRDGCSKWADLDEHLGGGLCQSKGCKNGEYFVPGSTFMNLLDEPFGEVNTRYTCCTFLALTKGVPSYCDRFEFGSGLVEYCKNDYQGYGLPYSEDEQRSEVINGRGKYILISYPATLNLNSTSQTFTYESDMEGEGPKLFLRRKYYGDFPDLRGAIDAGVLSVKQLKIEFDSEVEIFLYYKSLESIDMPPNNGSEPVSIDSVEINLEILEVVVDYRNGIVIGIEFEVRFLFIVYENLITLFLITFHLLTTPFIS